MIIKKTFKIGNETLSTEYESGKEWHLEMLKEISKAKNTQKVQEVTENLLQTSCPFCKQKLKINTSDKFWYFFSHLNEVSATQCPWDNGKKTWSPEQLDCLLNKNETKKCQSCINEWLEPTMKFRRAWATFPYTKAKLEQVKDMYNLSVEDILEFYYNAAPPADFFGCWNYKDTSHKDSQR